MLNYACAERLGEKYYLVCIYSKLIISNRVLDVNYFSLLRIYKQAHEHTVWLNGGGHLTITPITWQRWKHRNVLHYSITQKQLLPYIFQ